jgi:succinate-semialdehyde dehydrogenase/glutarate-semialdehyde dehydrogenase
MLKPRRALGVFPGLTKAWELRHAKGVVGIISPWNYPFELAASDAIPALLAGNGVVSKPDSQTVLTALWAHELMEESGLPPRLWHIVAGAGPVIGPAVIESADFVSFTGSTPTGREVATRAAASLTGVSLELGGKNAMIVLPDADLDRTVAGAVDACFSSSGQLCISMERVYVHERVYDMFTARFADAASSMRLGSTYDFTMDMGSLISSSQLEKVTAHVEDAKTKGATVLAGGSPRPDLGPYFFEPTVLANVGPHMTVCTEETFGPVVSVYKYRDVNEVIERANNTPYGLTASVWTRDTGLGRRIAARLEAGTVNVNDGFVATYGTIGAPMGGMKDSGLGRRHGRDGLLRFTEPQTVAVQRLVVGAEPPVRWMSYNTWRKLVTHGLRMLKRLHVR